MLRRCGRIRKSFHKAATYTLLDAAALACTAPLDLSDVNTAPDFTALSFYKIFGFPNVGALIIRKASAHVLSSRKYFGGGTVDMIIAINDTWHAKKETSIHDRLEDGTLPFHSIFALDHAMTVHERLYGPNPMKFISHHTSQLGRQLYDSLSLLRHSNGAPVIRIYKDDCAIFGDPSLQGATIAFNVIGCDGSAIGYEDVEEAADERDIFVRSGSLCNPGGVATYLNWSAAEMRAAYAAGHRCTNPTQIMIGKPTGVVRVSLGAMSTASDVRTLIRFLDDVYAEKDGRTTAAVAQATQMAQTIQVPIGARPVSPMTPVSLSPGNLPPLNTLGLQAPGTVPANVPDSAAMDISVSPLPLPDSGIGLDASERPRFIPSDYTQRHRPWQEEMRKGQYTNIGMEIKVRELDDASALSRNPTPSVKARKFGRSVVNLLRTKSHFQDGNTRYVQAFVSL